MHINYVASTRLIQAIVEPRGKGHPYPCAVPPHAESAGHQNMHHLNVKLFITPQLRNTAIHDTCRHYYRSTSRQHNTEIATRDELEIIRHTVRIWHR